MAANSETESTLEITKKTLHALTDRSLRYWDSFAERGVPEVLYHYTGMAALFGILDSQSLHLGHVDQMNDPDEVAYFDRVFRDAVALYVSKPEGASGFFSFYYEQGLDRIGPDQELFAFCMSESQDEISQWQMYGDSCKGVCIGIDLKKSWLGLRHNFYSHNGIALGMGRVRYDLEEQMNCATTFIESWDSFYKAHWVGDAGDSTRACEAFAHIMGGERRKLASYLKAPCWASEKEWRLVASFYGKDLGKLAGAKMSRDAISAFVVMKCPTLEDPYISSVILGPLSSCRVDSPGLRCHMARNHLAPSLVSKSCVAMRTV